MFNVIDIENDGNYFNPNLKLCKANKVAIRNLKDAYNKKLRVKLGNINELSFDIPYYISRDHKIIKNPLVDELLLGHLVRLNFKDNEEYFVASSRNNSLNNDGESIHFDLQSLSYKLGKFDVYEFITDTENISTTMNDLLSTSESRWKLGTVSSQFDSIFRSINIQSSTVLESIFTICQTFGAIPQFDTVNKIVNILTLDSTGSDKGLQAKEGKFLESYDINENLDEIVTRLKCYGKEGLEFRSLSPTGSNYIQDFSYFISPFEQDNNGNVIRSSKYLSDELCVALINYENLLENNNNRFNELVEERTEANATLNIYLQQLANLNTTRKTYENEIDLLNLTYNENATSRTDWRNANTNLNNVIVQINNVNSQINSVNNLLTNITTQINVIGTILDVNNNFSEKQLDELSEYIYIKEFTDENIITERDLLEAGLEQFNKYREPKFTLQFSIGSFLNDFRFRNDRRKINLGDLVTFNSKKFNTKVRTRIVEIEYDLDTLDISITTSNDIEKLTDEELLIDLLNYNNSLNKNIEKNLYKLDLGQSANQEVTRLLNTAFDTGRTILTGGYQSTNEMTERGFYSRNFRNPELDFLVINGGGMYITRDGARSVEVAINSDGVHANRLVGRFILSNRLQIDSTSGIINLADNSITISDNFGTNRVILGRYTLPETSNSKYGLYILDGAFDLRTSSTANRGVQLDANGIRAYNSNGSRVFEIDSAFGDLFFTGTISSSTINGGIIQTTTDVDRGIKINDTGMSGYDALGNRNFYLTTDGTLNVVDGNFTGNITGSNITGGLITGTDITGVNITGANFTGGTIDINTDASVGRILRVGRFQDFTNDSAALVFGDQAVEANNAYVRATYVFGQTALSINAQAGITLATSEAGINLNASSTNVNGQLVVSPTGTIKGLLGIVSSTGSVGTVLEFYRSSFFNTRLGFVGYDSSSNAMAIQNNVGNVSLINTGTEFRINTSGALVLTRSNAEYAPITASEFVQSSKRELKKNITKLEDELNFSALEKINSTIVYSYNYNNELDSEHKHTGLLLDEAPVELVNPRGEGIDIYAMCAILWKSVQELTNELEELKKVN